MDKKKALITGINGQDGSYLSELLVEKGYEVWGIVKRNSVSETQTTRIDHLRDKDLIHLEYADLTDMASLVRVLSKIQPDEIYHLGAQSHVRVSFDAPEYTGDVTGLGSTRLLESVRLVSPASKFYNAASSEMYGATPPPQAEDTSFYPRSPYGAAKLYSYWMTRNYREAYGMFACNGILFNHESPRRGETFVTKKITKAVAQISLGKQNKLYLGNLHSVRDWGYAPEYVEAMWLMLQLDEPQDFVISTGKQYSVQQFVEMSFDVVGLNWQDHVEFDERYVRPTEVDSLIGDSSKAHKSLGWTPGVLTPDLVSIMVSHDLRRITDPSYNKEEINWRH